MSDLEALRMHSAMMFRIERALALATFVFGVLSISTHAFGASLYTLLTYAIPQQGWAVIYLVFSTFRLYAIGINGSDISYLGWRSMTSLACLLIVWIPFIASFTWFAAEYFINGSGSILPGIILSPMVAYIEYTIYRGLRQIDRMQALVRRTG